jgi:hypothetical protein
MENATYVPMGRLAVTFAQDTSKGAIVKVNGATCGAGELAFGVTEYDFNSGDPGSVIVSGTALVKTAAQVAKGDLIMSNADGLAIVATTGNYTLGQALGACVTNDFVEVVMKSIKI